MGDRKIIAVEDIGRCALGIFKRGPGLAGKRVGVAGEHLTGAQMASAFARALGQEVTYNAGPFEVYRGPGFPGADDLGNMFQFKHDVESDFCGARDVTCSRALNPSLQTLNGWLAAHKDRIPLE